MFTGVWKVYVAHVQKCRSEQVTSQMLAAWPPAQGWSARRASEQVLVISAGQDHGSGRMDPDYNLEEILPMKESWLDFALMPESVSNQTPSGYLWAAGIGKQEAETSLQLEKMLGDKVHSASGYRQSGR